MKKVIKWILSPKKLSKWSADGIQQAINKSRYSEQIEKYGALADKITAVQKWMTEILKDGKVDDLERSEIESKLLPVFNKLLELI
jgi:hypothetical protein